MKYVIFWVGRHHKAYVNYALEMKKGVYIRTVGHTYKNRVIKLRLISLHWAHGQIGCLSSPSCYCNIITFTRLILLHTCGGQLFIYTNDCAIHPLFMVSVGLSSWSDADRGKWRGSWEWKLDCTLKDTFGLTWLRRNHLLPFRDGASVPGKALNLWWRWRITSSWLEQPLRSRMQLEYPTAL